MSLGLELDYRLRWMDFDRYGRMQPVSVLDLFQDVATLQAENMGIGFEAMRAKGVFWAVVRMRYEVVRAPEHYQLVTVRTWPHTLTRFSFLRDFSMRDREGGLLVKATSEWVLMDVEARKFAKVTDHYDGPEDFDDARSFSAKPRKLADFDGGNRPPYTVTPGFADIDANGHVNNARYANYVMNALDPGPGSSLKAFQIDYRHEVLPGAPLTMHTRVDDGLVQSKGVREDGNVAFACAIDLG